MEKNPRLKANYIGYYNNKNISHIGEIKARVILQGNVFIEENTGNKIDESIEIRLREFIKEFEKATESFTQEKWVDKEKRFFISDEIYTVNMERTSDGGIFGARYLKIEDFIDSPTNLSLKELAKKLENKKWRDKTTSNSKKAKSS